MNRYNIFNQIHKALRAILYDVSLDLQRTSFENREEAGPVLEKARLVLSLFDQHASIEDNYILPNIQKYEPATVEAFEKEHVEDHVLGQRLRSLLSNYEHSVSDEEKRENGLALTVAFVDFMVFNLKHMAKEEVVLNRLLWQYYTDAEIFSINQRIVADIPVEERAVHVVWMIRGCSNTEMVNWFRSVRREAPRAIFEELLSLASNELPLQRFQKITDNILEETKPVPMVQ